MQCRELRIMHMAAILPRARHLITSGLMPAAAVVLHSAKMCVIAKAILVVSGNLKSR